MTRLAHRTCGCGATVGYRRGDPRATGDCPACGRNVFTAAAKRRVDETEQPPARTVWCEDACGGYAWQAGLPCRRCGRILPLEDVPPDFADLAARAALEPVEGSPA